MATPAIVKRLSLRREEECAQKRPWGAIALFLAPTMVFYLIFTIYPLLATVWYSFHKIAPVGGRLVTTFVGFENFIEMFRDDLFHIAVRNTAIWGLLGPTIEMITSTSLALFIYFKVPFRRFFRTAWFLPVLVSGVIVGLVFRWIFNYDWGLMNAALRAVGLDNFALNWLGRRDTPLFVVIFVHWWSTFGNSFILLLAGLTAIPEELIDAAYVDGATNLQVAAHVLLPILRPTFITVLILSFMGKMRAFNVAWVLTQGGPVHASETVATYVQKRAFYWHTLDLGYPSTLAVFWFGVVMISVGLLNRWLQRES
jgi:multiple sugar transport system permease protein/raffinose/stachyose/melibiose transport system permease protein